MEETTEQKTTVASLALKQGIILGIILIIFGLAIMFTGQMSNQSLGFIAWILVIGVIIWTFNIYKKENQGFMSFSEGLGLGSLTTILAGAIASAFNAVYMMIDSSFVKNMLVDMRRKFEENPQLSDEQIDTIMKSTEYFMQPLPLLIIGILVYAVFGFILSLIIAAIMKKSNPNPF